MLVPERFLSELTELAVIFFFFLMLPLEAQSQNYCLILVAMLA